MIWPRVKRLMRWATAAALLFALSGYGYEIVHEGDTGRLLQEVTRMFDSLAQGRFTGWEGYFPPLQQIPVLLLMLLGLKDEDKIFHVLGLINLVSFALLLLWGWRSLVRKSARLALIYVVVVLTGPLVWYGHSTLGEMLAAMVTLGAIVACRDDAPAWKVFLLSLLATISKDTAFPFTFTLGLVACARVRTGIGGTRLLFHRWRLILLATLLGATINATLNYARFGSVVNGHYASPEFMVPSLRIQLDFALGLWLAPNGGMLFFWPSFCALVALGALSALGDRTKAWRHTTPLWGAGFVLAGLTLGLSKWYAPFGWTCWGPRLLLPWCPAILFLLLSAFGSGIEQRVVSLLGASRLRHAVIATAIALPALPHFIAALRRDTIPNFFFATDDWCPRFAYFSDGAYYYRWMHHHMWTKSPLLLSVFHPRGDATTIFLSLAYGIFIAGLVLRLNRSAGVGVPTAAVGVHCWEDSHG
jgi:hypothetical protein